MSMKDVFETEKQNAFMMAPFIAHSYWTEQFTTALTNEGDVVTEENVIRVQHLCRMLGRFCAVHLTEPEVGRKISGILAELKATKKGRPMMGMAIIDERNIKGGVAKLMQDYFCEK